MKPRHELRAELREEFVRNQALFHKLGRFQTLQFYLVVTVFSLLFVGGAAAYGIVLLLRAAGVVESVASVALAALIVCLVITTIVAAVLSRRLVGPMEAIIAASRAAAGGDFSVRVSTAHTFGEVRALVESFNYMNRELSGIELFRKDFISSFSHEFKTPIVSIRGFAEQLIRGDLTEDEKRDYARLIVRESDRLTALSSNILLLTRLENQAILSEHETFSLDEQLRDAVLLFQREWEKKGIEPDVRLDSVYYCGNKSMLEQVWTNLLSNAIKFTGEGGQISVTCRREGENVQVTVADTGIGMDAETRRHVFERFYQGDAARSSGGNGLGLPIARRIVELCGGSITVSSALGYGTEFTVTLPAA